MLLQALTLKDSGGSVVPADSGVLTDLKMVLTTLFWFTCLDVAAQDL